MTTITRARTILAVASLLTSAAAAIGCTAEDRAPDGANNNGGAQPPAGQDPAASTPTTQPTAGDPTSSTTTPEETGVPDPGLDGPPFSLKDAKCVASKTKISCLDVVYSVVGGVELHVDIQAPLSALTAKVPTIFYLHGGGWSLGTYHDPGLDVEGNIASGRAVLSVEYRLTLTKGKPSGVTFPEDLRDVKTAVRWMKTKGADFIDGANILAYGFSAGAHLASLMSTTAKVTAFEGRGPLSVPSTVKAVVALSSPYDFHIFLPQNPPLPTNCPSQDPINQTPIEAVSLLVGGDITDPKYSTSGTAEYETLNKLNAATYLDSSAAPMLSFAGTCDQTVPSQNAEVLNQAAASKNAPQVKGVVVQGATHGGTLSGPGMRTMMQNFVTAQIGP